MIRNLSILAALLVLFGSADSFLNPPSSPDTLAPLLLDHETLDSQNSEGEPTDPFFSDSTCLTPESEFTPFSCPLSGLFLPPLERDSLPHPRVRNEWATLVWRAATSHTYLETVRFQI